MKTLATGFACAVLLIVTLTNEVQGGELNATTKVTYSITLVHETSTGRKDTLIAHPGGIQIIYNDDIAWFQMWPLTGQLISLSGEMLIRYEDKKCFMSYICDTAPQEYLDTRLDLIPYFYLDQIDTRKFMKNPGTYLSYQQRLVFCESVKQLFSLALPSMCSGFHDEVWYEGTDTSVLVVRAISFLIGKTFHDVNTEIRCTKTVKFLKPPHDYDSQIDTTPVRAFHRCSMWGDDDSVKVVFLETKMNHPYRRMDDPRNQVKCTIELRRVEPFLADEGWYTGIGDTWKRIPAESIPPFTPDGPPRELREE